MSAAGADASVGADESPKWTAWAAKCPMGSQCAKRDQYIKKCETREGALEAVINHLQAPPYHEFPRHEAELAVDYENIESWEINKKDWMDDRNKWEASKKRKAAETKTIQSWGSRGSSASGAGTNMITLSEMQLRACVDSLKRAE
eukprot:1003556-Pyramimonas_sp.AAC.1